MERTIIKQCQPQFPQNSLTPIYMERTITMQILRRNFLKFSKSSIWKERLPSKPQSQLPQNSQVIDTEGPITKQTSLAVALKIPGEKLNKTNYTSHKYASSMAKDG
jgi:hypothetical protein